LCGHTFQRFRCEYGIGRHSNESLSRTREADYPNLALKPKSLTCSESCRLVVNTGKMLSFLAKRGICFSARNDVTHTDLICASTTEQLEFPTVNFDLKLEDPTP
jgi:hypothetical protein